MITHQHWLLSIVLWSSSSFCTAKTIDATDLAKFDRPWALQSVPDYGGSTAAGMVYDHDNHLLYVTGTTSGSLNFPPFVSTNDDRPVGSDCFLATIQPPEYNQDGQYAQQKLPDWHSAYRMGVLGSGVACTAVTRARHQSIFGDEHNHIYALGFQHTVVKRNDNSSTMELAITETLVDATVNQDTEHIWDFREMTHTDIESNYQENQGSSSEELPMLYPVAITSDPVLPHVYTLSQASPTYQAVSPASNTATAEVVLHRYTVINTDESSKAQLVSQDYKVAFDGTAKKGVTISTLHFADRHKVLLMAGSTAGGGSAFGGDSLEESPSGQPTAADWDGFVTKLDPETGTVVHSKRIFSVPSKAATATENDSGGDLGVSSANHDRVYSLCLDDHEKAIFVVGSTQGTLLIGNDNDDGQQPSGSGAFLIKLDYVSMEVLWVRKIAGEGVQGLACQVHSFVDDRGQEEQQLFWAGRVPAHVSLTDHPALSYQQPEAGTSEDIFCAKLDAETGGMQWLSRLGSEDLDVLAPNGGGLVVDMYGNPILCGTTFGNMARSAIHQRRGSEEQQSQLHLRHSDVYLIQLSGRDGSRIAQPLMTHTTDNEVTSDISDELLSFGQQTHGGDIPNNPEPAFGQQMVGGDSQNNPEPAFGQQTLEGDNHNNLEPAFGQQIHGGDNHNNLEPAFGQQMLEGDIHNSVEPAYDQQIPGGDISFGQQMLGGDNSDSLEPAFDSLEPAFGQQRMPDSLETAFGRDTPSSPEEDQKAEGDTSYGIKLPVEEAKDNSASLPFGQQQLEPPHSQTEEYDTQKRSSIVQQQDGTTSNLQLAAEPEQQDGGLPENSSSSGSQSHHGTSDDLGIQQQGDTIQSPSIDEKLNAANAATGPDISKEASNTGEKDPSRSPNVSTSPEKTIPTSPNNEGRDSGNSREKKLSSAIPFAVIIFILLIVVTVATIARRRQNKLGQLGQLGPRKHKTAGKGIVFPPPSAFRQTNHFNSDKKRHQIITPFRADTTTMSVARPMDDDSVDNIMSQDKRDVYAAGSERDLV